MDFKQLLRLELLSTHVCKPRHQEGAVSDASAVVRARDVAGVEAVHALGRIVRRLPVLRGATRPQRQAHIEALALAGHTQQIQALCT